ncbi:hypothetical protein M405DRAFT_880569 [Rhizopogon salebrosus TDB-379]|nr:hypothetical protein M405DRAFT_880569 [Rhizopogon salebrosus TDB-379]
MLRRTQPNSNPQRKFIELIFKRTGKYANWDPPSEIRVGSYGRIDSDTGDLIVQGTIYSDEFRQRLVDIGINVESGEHLPKDCPDEVEFTTWSKNITRLDLTSNAGIPGIDTATIKGTWEVKKGSRGAVLLMHNPRMKHITADVLGKLAKIELLQSMHLVTKVFYCPAYSLYLSDKSGDRVSIALLGSVPVDATTVKKWWYNTQTGFARCACNTEHCFTPLYELMHVRHTRTRRSSSSPERIGEQLWITPPLPWAPLDEDGNDVPVYLGDSDSDEFEDE